MTQSEYISKSSRLLCDELLNIPGVQSVIILTTSLDSAGETMITWTGKGNSAATFGAMHAYMQNQKLKLPTP